MSKNRSFSVELNSKSQIKNLVMTDSGEHVLFEGAIGELRKLGVIEEAILEIKGSNGIIRLELTKQEAQNLLREETEIE